MDELIQQVPDVISPLIQQPTSESTSEPQATENQQLLGAGSVAANAVTRQEAGDKLDPPQRKTMSLAAMVDSLDDDKSQEQQEPRQKRDQKTISKQTRLGRADDSSDRAAVATEFATLNQQTDSRHPPPAARIPTVDEGSAGSNDSTLSRPKPAAPQSATKQNGLKNRQRPPPLVLDKVSNFYDNVTNSCIVQPTQGQPPQQSQRQLQAVETETQTNSIISDELAATSNKSDYHATSQQNAKNYQTNQQQPVTSVNSSQIYDDKVVVASDRTHSSSNGNNNNPNQKFWASLNENVSRNKALASARGISAAATLNEQQPSPSLDANGLSEGNLLGPDLIIKKRNSSGSISSSRVLSTLAARKQQPSHQQPPNQNNAYYSIDDRPASDRNREQPAPEHQHRASPPPPQQQQQQQYIDEAADPIDQLNNSNELEECLLGADNNAGGNLIGVETTATPPASDSCGLQQQGQERQTDEPPPSATSSRPRSNNPFLDDNDEEFEEYRNSIRSQSVNRDSFSSQDNNFQTRPASFIAATDRMTGGLAKPPSDFSVKQRIVEEKLSELLVGGRTTTKLHAISREPTSGAMMQHQQRLAPQVSEPPDQLDSCELYQPVQTQHQSHMFAPNRAAVNSALCGLSSNLQMITSGGGHTETEISIASESAVRQLPPSATTQLPHWSEATYELNNAILERRSIAGGAENGQFIYIIESGDLVLELDQVKVPGYTLAEFTELVEAKQFHLLKAVQTKHSQGLSLSLRDYLAASFVKNSKDKRLQGTIRENIYRQTIPCTTRPPKSGELDKVDYHFLTKEQFMCLNRQSALLECGVYGGHYYGTLKPLCDLSKLLSDLSQALRPETYVKVRRAWDASHPAVEMIMRKDASIAQSAESFGDEQNPLYENHESLGLQQRQRQYSQNNESRLAQLRSGTTVQPASNHLDHQHLSRPQAGFGLSSIEEEPLPPGWDRVMDQTHGTYYIDHNTQRTQYERPYQVELTKGSMGFGFTLVEADSGLLLVRSVIPGGPAHMNGHIRPGDLLISAVGVPVTGLQHTDIARLFSTFAVGDRVRLTFARSNYVLDENLVPDEYLFSNGTNGDLAVAVNPSQHQLIGQNSATQNPHILVNQEFEFIKVTLKRGDQGFGFTISDSMAGQRVRKIQNHEICSNLKQGDILIDLNGEDIAKMTHKEVVERLKKCPPGDDVTLTIKRKKRCRSKTPMALHTDASGEFSLDSTPQRNCKTPNLDGLMLRHPTNYDSRQQAVASRSLFQPSAVSSSFVNQELRPQPSSSGDMAPVASLTVANGLPAPTAVSAAGFVGQQFYGSLSPQVTGAQSLYGENIYVDQQHQDQQPGQVIYEQHEQHTLPQPQHMTSIMNRIDDLTQTTTAVPTTSAPMMMRPNSNQSASAVLYKDSAPGSVQASEALVPQPPSTYHSNHLQVNNYNQINQYNNFMNNDKLVMMRMQQHAPGYHHHQQPAPQIYSSDYHQVPLYSNSEVMNNEFTPQHGHPAGLSIPALPLKQPINQLRQQGEGQPQLAYEGDESFQDNFYANNDEIAIQSMQYGYLPPAAVRAHVPAEQFTFMRPISHETPHDEHDEFEYHNVNLERENTDSNWGIRLIGGAEVERAISIGSMIFGGVAAKSGKLKSGDEIISIDGVNVIGATHKCVVDLISACTNRVSLVVRRKTFAEACDVVLTKNMDEGFGFVIISNENCALIGKIIEGSPADRCKQLRVRDCIIAVNGRLITPDMKHPEIVNMIKDCGSTLRLRIIPVDCYTVKLIKDIQNDSFGFRMRGGSEYDGTPLYIVRVESNGQAQGLLNVGDQILEINNIPTVGMTHHQAATIIKYSDPIVKLKLRRNYVTPPSLLVDSPRSLQKYNQTAEMKQVNLASTPTLTQSTQDASFASLPANINLMAHKFQQPLHMTPYREFQSDEPQPIYNHHPISCIDQTTLYAS